MWLSKQMKPEVPTADADLGMTTIGGESAGVVTRGEVRDLPVYGPGGYVWLPENGATVLVIKGGPGGEEQCVVGARQSQGPTGMQPGEIYPPRSRRRKCVSPGQWQRGGADHWNPAPERADRLC